MSHECNTIPSKVAAKMIGCGLAKLRELREERGLPHVRLGPRKIVYVPALIEAWIMLDYSWSKLGNLSGDADALAIVIVIAVLLIFSELVRVGRSTSIGWLMWLGFIARFAALGWAAYTAVVGPGAAQDSGRVQAETRDLRLPLLREPGQ